MQIGKKTKNKKRKTAALSHRSMAFKLYTQIRDSHAWKFQNNLSVNNIIATTFVFFHVLCKTSNVEIQLFCLWFCIIHMFF